MSKDQKIEPGAFLHNLYNHRRIIIDICIALLFLFIGFIAHSIFSNSLSHQKMGLGMPLREPDKNYKFISPLLAVGDLDELRGHDDIRKNVERLLHAAIRDKTLDAASVYLRTLKDGEWMSINENEKYSPASLYKAALLIAYLKKADTDPALLSKKVIFNGSTEKEGQNDEFTPMIVGHTYTIEDLLYRLIVYSDNDAKDLLHNNLDVSYTNYIFTDLSLPIPGINDIGDIATVDAYSIFFRVLYNATYLSKPMSEMALKLLSQTEFKEGLVAGVPGDLVVSHKFGYRQVDSAIGGEPKEQLHDCGILYYPNRPYFLCVMTKGYDVADLKLLISRISNEVYKDISGK